ncbi:MAG: hypothetical protein MI741_18975 [Rhodospirillales bacterium]|nr:hypothetical protein [Rhodospirillales bacterium]
MDDLSPYGPIPDEERSGSRRPPRKSITIALVALSVTLLVTLLIYGLSFLLPIPNPLSVLEDDGIRTTNAATAIEERYGLRIAFPEGWTADNCSPETKRYLGQAVRYVCRFASSPHPDSGVTTAVYLFVVEDGTLSDGDVETFARERQEFGWAGEMASNAALSVTFDSRFDTVSYQGRTGLQVEDIVFNRVLGGWDLWTSTILPVSTPDAVLLLEVTHPNDTISGRSLYDVENVLQYITVLN